MKGSCQLKDIPSFIRTTNPDDFLLNYVQRMVLKLKQASAILLNSFDALEHDVLEALSSDFPTLYTLGPLQLLHDSIKGGNDEEVKTISTSLWKEDARCLEWLDSYEPNSVVYVNFGSITVITNDQLMEFAWGLANSNQPFLWIARPDLVTGDSANLPLEFLEETKGRGLIASWCNQKQVLAHPAVGGFLTHCGWNSTIETLISGVPIICWPFFAEQQTNCWFSCHKWGIGMEIDTNVKRGEVERQVRELLAGEKGKDMKRNAIEWKRLANEAVATPNGSSYNNLDKWEIGMEIDANVKRSEVERQVRELMEGEKGKEMKRKTMEWRLAYEATAVPNGSSYNNLDKVIEVLSHSAVGGFLTHCGWNSTIETLISGVPIICWPFFAEQQTNCWFSCHEWGIGMEVDANVKRSEVERQLRELMEGEKGKEMKKMAMEWRILAYEAAAPNGSSYNNLDKVIEVLGSLK
uniref:Glycosyltransferase n=1 Tax=Chenopodium quinoa TaxID=63459 RepID=A0A803LUP8_CHEQI